MGRQSSRIYFNGKDHKDIYFNGKFHSAMYFKDQGGIIWQKLGGGFGSSYGSLINTKVSSTTIGINKIYENPPSLDATYTADRKYGNVFDTIISGENRVFGIKLYDKSYLSYVWVTNDGGYWKKIGVSNKVKWVYPCYDGFLYADNKNNVSKVVLDSNNDFVSERLIYEDLYFLFRTYEQEYGYKYQSNGGIWTKDGLVIKFLTHTGLIIEYAFDERSENAVIEYCFTRNNINYAYITGSFYNEETGSNSTRAYVLSCDGSSINVVVDSGAYVSNPNNWIRDVKYIIPWGGQFYLFYSMSTTVTIKSTDLVATPQTVEEWNTGDYIELQLIGGESNGIDTVRLNLSMFISEIDTRTEYVKNGNVANFTVRDARIHNNFASIFENNLVENGAFYEGGYGNASVLAIYLDSPIITKQTTGFAYFTDNIGVGVSYP